jgi:hypothetical protein
MLERNAHRVYKNLVYNRDIRRDALSDVRTNIHPQQSSIHILQTTNTLAYASNCTHVEIRKHHPSYITHAANAYTRWPVFLAPLDEWVIVLVVESSKTKGECVSKGNVRALKDTPQE